MSRSILVAMSGGVDSSVAALLLKAQGYDCHGVTMQLFSSCELFPNGELPPMSREIEDARLAAEQLGIPFSVCDLQKDFRNTVMDYFVRSYEEGSTPNPCVECNRCIKFGRLLDEAHRLQCSHLATGHYARITQDGSGRMLLSMPRDRAKDQTYVLWSLSQKQLSQTLLPLGDLTKAEVREIAEQNGLQSAARRDSQDVCFIPDGDYASFLMRYTKKSYPEGNFVDADGRVLGRHRGIIHYTVGQRKGLGIAFGKPTYVCGKNAEDGTVLLGSNEDLFARELTAHSINLIALPRIDSPLRVEARIRYSALPAPATVEQTDEDTLRLRFDEPQRAITPGQSVVLYDGETVIGGGIISTKEILR